MELKIIDVHKTEIGKMKLPLQFSEEIRPDIIMRAVEVIQANTRQPYGNDDRAGKKHSTKISRRRRDYKGSYGHGISRVPRKILSHRGTQFNWVAARAPGTVGGARAHPPKADKEWGKKINIKEKRKAIRAALAAVVNSNIVKHRGHLIPSNYPFVISGMEQLAKTKDVVKTLESLGFKDELARVGQVKHRAGKGKLRGRRYIVRKGPLLVVSKDCRLKAAARNIMGIDIIEVNRLNASLLAPGGSIGRLTLFSQEALQRMEKEHLFV